MDYDFPDDCNYFPNACLGCGGMSNYHGEHVMVQTVHLRSPNQHSVQLINAAKRTTQLCPHQTNANMGVTTTGTYTYTKTITTSNGTTTTVSNTISTPTGAKTTIINTNINKKHLPQKVKETPKAMLKVTSPPPLTTTKPTKPPTGAKQQVVCDPKKPEEKWKTVRPGSQEEKEIRTFHIMTNDFRRKNNKPPLEFSIELSEIARPHNENMIAGRTPVGHEGFKERADLIDRAMSVGENCAMYEGPKNHLQTLMENLIKSKPHRENMLNDFNALGVAIGKNSKNRWFVTQFFAIL